MNLNILTNVTQIINILNVELIRYCRQINEVPSNNAVI